MSDSVMVPRGSLNAIMAHAEAGGDLGTIGKRCLEDLRAALSAPPAPAGDLVERVAVEAVIDKRIAHYREKEAEARSRFNSTGDHTDFEAMQERDHTATALEYLRTEIDDLARAVIAAMQPGWRNE